MKIAPPKIMLVDDEPHVIEYISEILSQISFEVVGTASSADAALPMLADVEPDMVILDITMPGMTGDELIVKVKERLPEACVVMLTSRNTIDMVKTCRDSGAAGYLLKSETGEKICQRIQEIWFGRFLHTAMPTDASAHQSLNPRG